MGRAAMHRILALVGAVFLGTIGVANAETIAPFSGTTTITLTPAWLLPHSDNDGQLSKESARSSDRMSTGGFRTEFEAITEATVIPGQGITPVGNVSATRVMVSGLYELDGGAWRLKPFVGAGFGVMDISTILLGHEEQSFATDVQFKSGLNFNITQKLLGSFEWRWSQGSKPTFALGGVPTKFQLKRGGFMLGMNWKLQ